MLFVGTSYDKLKEENNEENPKIVTKLTVVKRSSKEKLEGIDKLSMGSKAIQKQVFELLSKSDKGIITEKEKVILDGLKQTLLPLLKAKERMREKRLKTAMS